LHDLALTTMWLAIACLTYVFFRRTRLLNSFKPYLESTSLIDGAAALVVASVAILLLPALLFLIALFVGLIIVVGVALFVLKNIRII